MFERLFQGRRSSGETVAVNSHVKNDINTNNDATTAGKNNKSTAIMTDERLDLVSTNEGQNRPGVVLSVPTGGELDRALSSSHLNMLAFSGSVGTGLIIGSGTSLHNGELQL
jgi:amino acid permease